MNKVNLAVTFQRRKMNPSPTCIISGVSRGIGHFLALEFARKWWTTVGLTRNPEAAPAILSHQKILIIPCDITHKDDVSSLPTKLLHAGISSVDVLINNAGITALGKTLSTADENELQSLFMTHCVGAFSLSKAIINLILSSEHKAIINMNSRFGSTTRVAEGALNHLYCSYAYRIAKSAQNMLTACIHSEYEKTGLNCMSIHPGRVKTKSASIDADLLPHEVAQNIFKFVEMKEYVKFRGKFFEIGKGDIPW